MSNRYIPYGYQFQNGLAVPHPAESRIVRDIFDRYCNGESLKQIADRLTAQAVEYSPGKTVWDKARIKRILENQKYLGAGLYPPLIPEDVFEKAQRRKEGAKTSSSEIDGEIKFLKTFAVCERCGGKIARRSDSRFLPVVTWKCGDCGMTVKTTDEAFKAQVFALQKTLAGDPASAELKEEASPEIYSIESKRFANEIRRQLDSGSFAEDELINMALRCGTETYQSINSVQHISDRLTADFAKAGPLSAFSKPLFLRTVKHIHITSEGNALLELQNGKIVTGR